MLEVRCNGNHREEKHVTGGTRRDLQACVSGRLAMLRTIKMQKLLEAPVSAGAELEGESKQVEKTKGL